MIEQYTAYFKKIAVNHPLIQHKDQKGKRTFFNINIEETQQSFRSGIKEKGLGMYLVDYTVNLLEGRRIAMGGFVIMGYSSTKSNDKNQVKQLTESVVYNILLRMQQDSQEGEELFNYSLDELSDVSIVSFDYKADSQYVGHLCTFKFADRWEECVEDTEWIDL